MTNIIIMLTLLTAPYLLARLAAKLRVRRFGGADAAAWGAGILFVFTGIGHFIQTDAFTQMLPPWVPQRTLLVYATGLLEFAIAAAFFQPRTRKAAAWAAIAVLVLFFPANIYAAFTRAPVGGSEWGPAYLLVRAPLQIFIIGWIYRFLLSRKHRLPQTVG